MKVQNEIRKLGSKEAAEKSLRYFKTGEGQYGHGDLFLGVRNPDIRKLAKKYHGISLRETNQLIRSKYHEERMLGLIIQVEKFAKTKDESEREKIYQNYIKQFKYINNWDLVDCSCTYIIGKHLMDKDRTILYSWAKSQDLWTRRIAIVSTWWPIRKGDLADVFNISELLLDDKEDLIHKAVGWMLREAGKKDQKKLEAFLTKHYSRMPRTALRYAIEKFPETKRLQYLKRKI